MGTRLLDLSARWRGHPDHPQNTLNSYVTPGRYVNSAFSRAAGPTDEHTSGQEFVLLTIGRALKFSKTGHNPNADTQADAGSAGAVAMDDGDQELEETEINADEENQERGASQM